MQQAYKAWPICYTCIHSGW